MRTINIETVTHGRVLIEDPADSFSGGLLVGFHGYGQGAGVLLEELLRIPGADRWRVVSVQGLHRFYTRGDQSVVASWMTREDRDHAIADNIEYVNRAIDSVLDEPRNLGTPEPTVVFLGFSQGASMAARAAAYGRHRAAGLILLGGDIPPEIKNDPSVTLPSTLVGCGTQDKWYGAHIDADVAFLTSRNIPHEVVRFDGGHEFTDEFRSAAGKWMARLGSPPAA